MSQNGIFIGGHSRTGTTLMQGLVCNHPQTIAVTREASYFRSLVQAYGLGMRWFDLHTCDYFDSPQALTDFHRSQIQAYLDHIQARFGDRPDAIIVQKEPRMTEVFPEIGTLLPGSKFIVMLRDLRDVIASQIVRCRENGVSYKVDQDLDRYITTLRNLIARRDILGERLLFVHYEALVNWPTPVMDEVWRFLEMENLHVDNKTRWATKRPRGDESASELDEQPPTADPIGTKRYVLTDDVLSSLQKVRALILDNTQMDCFCSDAVTDQSQAVIFLKDIVQPT
jgi:hypothetical protein